VNSALAVEDVSRFSGAFAFAPLWLFATADVSADFIAADDLLFRRNDNFFLIFRHFQVSLGSLQDDTGSNIDLSYRLPAILDRPAFPQTAVAPPACLQREALMD
jgi:hypothetical protein